jgi:hypothetical protein
MKAYRGSGCIDPHYLELGTSWRWVVSFTSRPLYPRERDPGTHFIGGSVDPRAGLDDVWKRRFLLLPGLELQPLGRPSCSRSLYRLRYPGSWSRCIDSHFLDLDTSWRWVVSFTPLPLYTRGKSPGTHWIGWVDPSADVEKRKLLTQPGLELWPLCRPARSQSLYRLRCPGSLLFPPFPPYLNIGNM